LRAPAPTPWAEAIQVAATPRPSTPKPRATGPGPLRTARGAGRRDRLAARDFVDFFFVEVRLLVGLRVLRDREVEPPRELPEDRDEDVLLLRDPGGEDVRVAMV
jgi:hypothetical protein